MDRRRGGYVRSRLPPRHSRPRYGSTCKGVLLRAAWRASAETRAGSGIEVQKAVDHHPVLDRVAVPQTVVGIGGDLELRIAGADRGPAEVAHAGRRGGITHDAAALVAELRRAIADLDRVAALVDEAVVETTLCRLPGYAA